MEYVRNMDPQDAHCEVLLFEFKVTNVYLATNYEKSRLYQL